MQLMEISTERIESLLNEAESIIVPYVGSFVGAIVVLTVGWALQRWLLRILDRFFEKKDYDRALETFLSSLVSILLKTLLIIVVISMLGVPTTSFVAILGAVGLAIGLSLQGSLANLAGGILILLFKPFRIGDYIVAQGHEGKVSRMSIFATTLLTADNVQVTLPNGDLSNGAIENQTAESQRRIDMVIGVGYSADLQQAEQVFRNVLEKDSRILSSPSPYIGVRELADNSVNFVVRPWVKTPDYWAVRDSLHQEIKIALDAAGIDIPFPQRMVHVVKD